MKLEFKAELMDEKHKKKRLEVVYTIRESGTERFEFTIFSQDKKGRDWKGETVRLKNKDLYDFFVFISGVRRRISDKARKENEQVLIKRIQRELDEEEN